MIREDVLWTTNNDDEDGFGVLVCDGNVMGLLMDPGDLLSKCPNMGVYDDQTGCKKM